MCSSTLHGHIYVLNMKQRAKDIHIAIRVYTAFLLYRHTDERVAALGLRRTHKLNNVFFLCVYDLDKLNYTMGVMGLVFRHYTYRLHD